MDHQNDLIAEAIINEIFYELNGYETIENDPSVFFDLLLTPPENSGYPLCHVAIAPVYEKKDAELLFPDTISVTNHHVLNHLAAALEKGERSVLILLAQRIDCIGIRAQWTADTSYLVELKELYENILKGNMENIDINGNGPNTKGTTGTTGATGDRHPAGCASGFRSRW